MFSYILESKKNLTALCMFITCTTSVLSLSFQNVPSLLTWCSCNKLKCFIINIDKEGTMFPKFKSVVISPICRQYYDIFLAWKLVEVTCCSHFLKKVLFLRSSLWKFTLKLWIFWTFVPNGGRGRVIYLIDST